METLSGEDLVAALSSAVNCLEQYRDVINALNVFPVPDGDTGTNMLLTMGWAVSARAWRMVFFWAPGATAV